MAFLRTMITCREDDRATIFVEGDIDVYTAPTLSTAVTECLSCGARDIDVDLARLTFCDASGLTAFLKASKRAEAAGGRLRLYAASPTFRRLLRITGTTFLLAQTPPPVRDTGEAASAAPAGWTAAAGDQ